MSEAVGPCTWGTGLAVAGPFVWVVRDLLPGLLAEGQEEVRAQWLGKVHLQILPHEQLEDIIANCLRRDKGGSQRRDSKDREEGEKKRNWGAGRQEKWKEKQKEVERLVGAGMKRPGGDRE